MDIAKRKLQSTKPESMRAACSHCRLGKLCFSHALPAAFRTLLPIADVQRSQLARGETLFSAGKPQTGIHAIKAGFLKTSIPLPDGQSKIIGFHAMGDTLGLDGLGRGNHTTDAVALSSCEVCVIPLERFEKLLVHPTESIHVRQLLARELSRVQMHAASIGVLTAKQRVATFLLDMSGRWEARGYSKNEFVLFMSRFEIGNYLGLTFETISRTFSYFQAKKWLTVHGKSVLILNMPALQAQLVSPNQEFANT